MRLIICFLLLLPFLGSSQKKWEKYGVIYSQVKEDLYSDSLGNLYLMYLCPHDTSHSPLCFRKSMPLISWEKYDELKDFVDVPSYKAFPDFPFSKDKKYVYFKVINDDGENMTILKGADPNTFEVIKNSEYGAQDKIAYYVVGKKGLETTPKNMNYKDVGMGFYRGDNGKLYIRTNVLKDVHKDKWGKLFYREVPNIDLETYTDYDLSIGYAKDKNHVYWRRGTTDGEFIDILEKADPLTFEIDSKKSWLAKDKNFYFDNGRAGPKKKLK